MARPWILSLAVAVVGAAVYAPAVGGGFIYDDHPLIRTNPYVHGFQWWKRWFVTDFWDVSEEAKKFGHRMIYWRPGVTASYAVDWSVGSGSPVLFHLTNLAWQALAAWLAFRALRRWMDGLLPALFAALIFAVHPTKAESVAWIAGRTDVLCTVALLLAAEGVARRLRGERVGWALELAATAFAYTVKEQAIVLPAIVGVEAWIALGRPAIDGSTLWRVTKAALPQAVLAVAYLAIRAKWLPVRQTPISIKGIAYLQHVTETMGRYFVLVFAPHDLSVQQGLVHTVGGSMVFDKRYIALGSIGIVALCALAVWTRKRRPVITVGLVFFAVTILPTSNVVNTGMMTMISERFLYLPMLGLAMCLASSLDWLDWNVRWARILRWATIVAIGVLAIQSFRRSRDFSDERRFWARELRLHPDSLEAVRYAGTRATEKKQYRRALEISAYGHSVAVKWYGHTGNELDFTIQGVGLMLRLVPDHDREALLSVQRFYRTLLFPGDATVASVAIHDLAVEVPLGKGPIQSRLKEIRARILVDAADLSSRLGDDAAALDFAARAVAECVGCADVGRIAAMVEARAGRYREGHGALDAIAARQGEGAVADTRELLRRAELSGRQSAMADEGPVKLKLRADELATLEAWGRAYDVLAPFKEQIKMAPGFAIGFSELAWRAGEPAVAREILSANVPAEKVELMLTEWSRKMGWIEPAKEPAKDPSPG